MPSTFNLNNYTVCSKEECSKILIPFAFKDGTQPPPVFLRHKGSKSSSGVADLAGMSWDPSLKFDVFQDTKDYRDCVTWWFKNATAEYKQNLHNEFVSTYGDTLGDEITKIKNWIMENAGFRNKNGKYTKRKVCIHQFIRTWLNRKVTFNFK